MAQPVLSEGLSRAILATKEKGGRTMDYAKFGRQVHIGFGAVATLAETHPEDLVNFSKPVMDELEQLILEVEKDKDEEEGLVIAVALRVIFNELTRLIAGRISSERVKKIMLIYNVVRRAFPVSV